MPAHKDAIGARGERIFEAAITKFHGDFPLFWPRFLGEKWPIADHIVELWGYPGHIFFVQVRTTRADITPTGRLPVSLSAQLVGRLSSMPIPAYIVGVHEPTEHPFIVTASTATRGGVSSIPTRFSLLDPTVRQELHEEVRDFWARAGAVNHPPSAFSI